MNNRIKDKIKETKTYIKELNKIRPKTFRDYEKNLRTKAACERYFEKISEQY